MRSAALLAALLLLFAPALARAKGNGDDPRHLWAYPSGVIVTSNDGKIWAPRTKEDEKREKAAQKAREKNKGKEADLADEEKTEDPEPLSPTAELSKLSKTLEARLTSCLTSVRESTESARQNGSKCGVSYEFTINADGTVGSVSASKRGDLPGCAADVQKTLETHKFEPPTEARPLDAKIELEGVILTDEEAQGRGFQFYEAEKTWEDTLKKNSAWFTCTKDADCVVTVDKCEVRGVNKASLDVYRQAINERKTNGCRVEPDAERFKVACKKKTCTASRK